MMLVLKRGMSLAGLGAVVAGMVLASGPAGADPGGTRDVNQVPSERPQIEVLGASSYGVLYKTRTPVHDAQYPQIPEITWVKPSRAAAYQVDGIFSQLAGDKIFGQVYTGYPVHYQVIGTPVTRRCDASPQPAGGYTPFGWISGDGDRVEAGATGCRVTAKYPPLDGGIGAADAYGYVVVADIGSQGERRLTYARMPIRRVRG